MIKLMNLLCLAVILFFALVVIFDLLLFLQDPDQYRFGTEIGGFRRLSVNYFFVSSAMIIVGALLALAVPKLVSSKPVVLVVRLGITLAVVLVGYSPPH